MVRRKRKKKVSKPARRIPRHLIVFIIIVLTIAGSAYVMSLPIWKIREVVVNGAVMLSAEEIRAMAGVPLSENLFFTGFSRAKSNLSKIPAVKSFRFYRIPPGTVLISITERKPIAAIVFPERSVIIDQEGYILNRNPGLTLNISNMADLPVISGMDEKKVMGSVKIDGKIAEVVSNIIVKFSRFLEARKMQLELGDIENVSFLLDDLLKVKIGDTREINRKMRIFETLFSDVVADKWHEVEYIDVRFPDNPVIKYK
jgi:cell division septal protein FtsQ